MSALPQHKQVTLTAGDTQYTTKITGGIKSIQFQARTNVAIKYSYNPGQIALGNYFTLKSGSTYSWEFFYVGTLTLCFMCGVADAGTIVEIEYK